MAEYAHASHTNSDPQAHCGALRPRPEHAGDRVVLGFLRRRGAARAPAVWRARHAGTLDPFMWAEDAAHRRAEATPAGTSRRAARRHAGRVGGALGPAVPNFDDRSLGTAAGLEV